MTNSKKSNTIVGILETNDQRMTSLEIAELTGKMHKDVMKAIRNMEPAWEQEHGRKFALMQIREDLPNNGYRLRPVYSLSKTECLYIATKFNDVARAKLVLRWEKLEREELERKRKMECEKTMQAMADSEIMAKAVLISTEHIKALTNKVNELVPKADYCDEVLDSVSCLTTTQIAKELEMSAQELNRRLCEMGILYRQSGQYMLYADYARRGYARNRNCLYHDSYGRAITTTYLVWTERGRNFIHQLFTINNIQEPNYLPSPLNSKH